jgi:N-hydroxyarylamine O-acetyltransferase
VEVGAYLERIGYDGPLEPTAGTLAGLHLAHMRTVPFENLDLHLGQRNVLDPDHVYDKIVTRRRGGWCYECNGLFALLLERLGFAVSRYSAAVALSEPPTPDFAHLTLRVDLDEPWLCDVGFGDSFTEPLRLTAEDDQDGGSSTYRLERTGARMTLLRDASPQYVFALEPRRMEQFQEMCDRLQTPPGHFTDGPICSLATASGRISLAGMRLIVTSDGDRSERELADEAERDAVLRETFGVDLGGARLRSPGA